MSCPVFCLTSDILHKTSDLRHQTSNVWHKMSDIRCLTSDIWYETLEAWYQMSFVRLFNASCQMSDILHQTSVLRHQISDIRHLMTDVWLMSCLMSFAWYQTFDIRRLMSTMMPFVWCLVWYLMSIVVCHLTSDAWHKTSDVSCQKTEVCLMPCLMSFLWHVFCLSYVWYLMSVVFCVTSDILHQTWHQTSDVWHLRSDICY